MEAMQRKLFVGGVLREATEATLREYFSKFGELDDCVIITDRNTGCSKGFGFVSFTEPAMAEQALNQHHHVILGRKVDVKPARPRGHREQEHEFLSGDNENQAFPSNAAPVRVKKIFVGGLPDGLTVLEFSTYFEKYGSINDVVVMHDEDGKPRGFGFITFESEDSASDVLQERFHELKGKMVEVKKAEPKERLVYDFVETYDSYNTGLACQRNFCPWRSFVYPLPVVYWPFGYNVVSGQHFYPQFNDSGMRPSSMNGESANVTDSDANVSINENVTSESTKTSKEMDFLGNQTETDENVSMENTSSNSSSTSNVDDETDIAEVDLVC